MITFEEIVKICGGKLAGNKPNCAINGFSIDTRTLVPGNVFVALRGDCIDGHNFLEDAFKKGAAGALVERETPNSGPMVIVGNSLEALQKLGQWQREKFSGLVVAVTGSSGKTTTKECIGNALSTKFKIRTSFGNWNNHLGVPLNLLRLNDEDECLVLELGANHPGEIALLSKIAQPKIGVITGVFPSHLEGFGSLEGIYKTKLELADFLEEVSGVLFINGDDPELIRRTSHLKSEVLTFGKNPECDYSISEVVSKDGFLSLAVNGQFNFRLQGYGAFNAMNALAAIAVADYCGVDLFELGKHWTKLPQIEGRFTVKSFPEKDILLVNDAYNSNPYSLASALQDFRNLESPKRRVVIMGDMLELGKEARIFHEKAGSSIRENQTDVLIGVGEMSRFALETFKRKDVKLKAYHFDNYKDLNQNLLQIIQDGDRILIKGSHGIRLDETVRFLEKNLSRPTHMV